MAFNSKSFERPLTAQEAVLAELRRAILVGDLKPNSAIVQGAISEELGVSRVPVREALRILEGEGLVRYAPHHGYSVAELSLEELLEIQRIRELLEPEAIRKTIPLIDENDLMSMGSLLDEMELLGVQGDIGAMNAAHRRFHFVLFNGAKMPRLIRILNQLWDASDPYRAMYHGDDASRAASQRDHIEIVRLAEARDTKALLRLLDDHRQHTIDRLSQPLAKLEDQVN